MNMDEEKQKLIVWTVMFVVAFGAVFVVMNWG